MHCCLKDWNRPTNQSNQNNKSVDSRLGAKREKTRQGTNMRKTFHRTNSNKVRILRVLSCLTCHAPYILKGLPVCFSFKPLKSCYLAVLSTSFTHSQHGDSINDKSCMLFCLLVIILSSWLLFVVLFYTNWALFVCLSSVNLRSLPSNTWNHFN